MKIHKEIIWYSPYPFIEGKRVKWHFWNGKAWIECDQYGRAKR